jgi:predicted SAM-dependent methyltransferase
MLSLSLRTGLGAIPVLPSPEMSALFRLMTAPIRRPLRALLHALPNGLGDALGFELHSLVGRLFARRLRLDPGGENYLNLGSAGDRYDGFINLDFFSSEGAYGADLRYPLLIDDAVVDAIFTEHTLEHLTYAEASRVLAECLRILKPGGRIRVVVPDLSIFVASYARNDGAWFKEWEQTVLAQRGRRMISKMEALSFVTQEYGHRSSWDFETLERFLADAGFTGVSKRAFGEGADPRLIRDKSDRDRTLVSLYVEALRPGTGARS